MGIHSWFGYLLTPTCCLGTVCVYSPARLLEDPEPRGKKHSQSGGRRRNCDGKGAQGAGSQWNQKRTHSYQGEFLAGLSIYLFNPYLLVNKYNFGLNLEPILSFVRLRYYLCKTFGLRAAQRLNLNTLVCFLLTLP